MTKIIPYLIQPDAHGEPLRQIDPSETLYQENWLQELLRVHPDILLVAEIEPVFHPLIPIGREVPTPVGYIDNLFISPLGYPVLVETKLWRNPEAKREVLAQVLDYASAISKWTFTDLDKCTREHTRHYDGKSLGLVDWVEAKIGLDVDRGYFEETVSKNLRLGRMLILVVGDRIRGSMVDILGYINQYPHLAVNAALIELQCYTLQEGVDWPLLVVPSILARTEIVERTIVQVDVAVDGTYQVSARQEKQTPTPSSRRSYLSEDAFWEQLKAQAPLSFNPVQRLVSYIRENTGITTKMRSNSIAFHFYLPDSGQRISLFLIRTDGIIECWHTTIPEQLKNGGLDGKIADSYVSDMSRLLTSRTKSLSIYQTADKVDIDAFIAAVDRFTTRLIQTEPADGE